MLCEGSGNYQVALPIGGYTESDSQKNNSTIFSNNRVVLFSFQNISLLYINNVKSTQYDDT